VSGWQVWSIDRPRNSAVVVDEGTEEHCTESAERRNAIAEENDVDALYMALGPGETP
jgi:hypothetical protein